MRGAKTLIFVVLAVQVLSSLFFFADIWGEILGLRTTPWPWELTEAAQVAGSFGMVVGVAVTAAALFRSQQRIQKLGRQIDAVSGRYQSQLVAQFSQWSLSQSEQAIMVYAMKGFSNAEIADLRGTTVSTVKSQMNAIYRKTGFANRQQLISFLVEEMIAGFGDPATVAADQAVADGPSLAAAE